MIVAKKFIAAATPMVAHIPSSNSRHFELLRLCARIGYSPQIAR